MNGSDFLIVSASTGTGHARAATALADAIDRVGSDVGYLHVDLLDLAPKWVRHAYGDGYELLATRTPRLWGQLYHRTDTADADRARWGPTANRILFGEFGRLLKSRKWRACICTHFLPGQLAASLHGVPPFATVITDLTLHRFWAQARVGRYFVANARLRDDLRQRVGSARIDVTGIPIPAAFASPPDRRAALHSLNLNPERPTVTVMGGGFGLGVEAAAEAVLATGLDLQVIVLCGRNDAARARLAMKGTVNCVPIGFVADVERYIAAADIVVTKPGGLTCSEITAIGRPLLLCNAIPGQEEGNARYLRDAGAAIEVDHVSRIPTELERLLKSPADLLKMASASRRAGMPHAADAIVGMVRREHLLTTAA